MHDLIIKLHGIIGKTSTGESKTKLIQHTLDKMIE